MSQIFFFQFTLTKGHSIPWVPFKVGCYAPNNMCSQENDDSLYSEAKSSSWLRIYGFLILKILLEYLRFYWNIYRFPNIKNRILVFTVFRIQSFSLYLNYPIPTIILIWY